MKNKVKTVAATLVAACGAVSLWSANGAYEYEYGYYGAASCGDWYHEHTNKLDIDEDAQTPMPGVILTSINYWNCTGSSTGIIWGATVSAGSGTSASTVDYNDAPGYSYVQLVYKNSDGTISYGIKLGD